MCVGVGCVCVVKEDPGQEGTPRFKSHLFVCTCLRCCLPLSLLTRVLHVFDFLSLFHKNEFFQLFFVVCSCFSLFSFVFVISGCLELFFTYFHL